MNRGNIFLFIVIIVLLVPVILFSADSGSNIKTKVRPRWMLEFSNDLPKMFTYNSPRNEKENYWYLVYQITNSTDDNIRLGIDICVKAVIDKNKTERDIYYQDAIHPIIEDGIIIAEEKLFGLNLGLQKERIKELKKQLKYLNCKELLDKKEIKPNETIKGIAVFSEFDRRIIMLEVMAGGLVDMVKWRYEKPPDFASNIPAERIVYEYESKIRRIIYECPGSDLLVQDKPLNEVKKEWLVRNYGPIGDKNGIEIMIESLKDTNPLIRWTGWYLLDTLTNLSFNYKPEDKPEDSQKSIDLYREWWSRNKDNVIYNSVLNKFEIKPPEKPPEK